MAFGLHVCVCTIIAGHLIRSEEGIRTPATAVPDGTELLCGCPVLSKCS